MGIIIFMNWMYDEVAITEQLGKEHSFNNQFLSNI